MNGSVGLHNLYEPPLSLAVFTPFLVNSSDLNKSDENGIWLIHLPPSVEDNYLVQGLYEQFALYYQEEPLINPELLTVTWELTSGTSVSQEVVQCCSYG